METKKCPFCGEEVLESAIKCKHCQGMISANSTPPISFNYPGFWTRFVAASLDSILLTGINGVLILIVVILFATSQTSYYDSYSYSSGYEGYSVLMFLIVVGVNLTWWIYFPGKYSATPGKMILKLKIVNYDGGDISYGTAFLRHIVGYLISAIILYIGYLMVAFHPEKRGLHDLIAGTKVIYRDR